MWTSTFIILL